MYEGPWIVADVLEQLQAHKVRDGDAFPKAQVRSLDFVTLEGMAQDHGIEVLAGTARDRIVNAHRIHHLAAGGFEQQTPRLQQQGIEADGEDPPHDTSRVPLPAPVFIRHDTQRGHRVTSTRDVKAPGQLALREFAPDAPFKRRRLLRKPLFCSRPWASCPRSMADCSRKTRKRSTSVEARSNNSRYLSAAIGETSRCALGTSCILRMRSHASISSESA